MVSRLEQASVEQRNEFELSAFGIHWEELDEDLSFEGFFKFQKGGDAAGLKTMCIKLNAQQFLTDVFLFLFGFVCFINRGV